MLRIVLVTWAKVLVGYTFVVGALYGLVEAGKGTDFDVARPAHYSALTDFVNSLLWFAVEHWLLLLLVTLCLALAWVFVVSSPREESKKAFKQSVRSRFPNKED